MTKPRDRRWLSVHGLIGGLTMFAIEALIVTSLAFVAWALAWLILALL
ncbi:MAG TPA: hypothetical protein VLA91_00450 [Acidimicrobiia bacterium]|nr:hypothetical protein [Acidimicrobiia bacterium]